MANPALTEEHIQILRRNHIDPAHYVLVHESDGHIVFLNHLTGHEVMVIRGVCKWL